MPECVAQRFTCDPKDLITHDRVQGPCRPFHLHTQPARSVSGPFCRKLLSQARDGDGQIVGLDRRGTQPLHGLPSFRDGLRCPIDRACERLLGVGRPLREQLVNGLEPKQQSLKALQQRIVQVTRDARALGHALVQARVERPRDLTQAQLVQRPKH